MTNIEFSMKKVKTGGGNFLERFLNYLFDCPCKDVIGELSSGRFIEVIFDNASVGEGAELFYKLLGKLRQLFSLEAGFGEHFDGIED